MSKLLKVIFDEMLYFVFIALFIWVAVLVWNVAADVKVTKTQGAFSFLHMDRKGTDIELRSAPRPILWSTRLKIRFEFE